MMYYYVMSVVFMSKHTHVFEEHCSFHIWYLDQLIKLQVV